jgi:V-type H+-transporting ATPase subunit E
LIRLNEPACSLVCRKADLARVKAASAKAAQTFKAKAMASKTHQALGQKGCKVTVNETTFLEPAPSPGDPPGKPSCCGGIVALNGNSTISCNNTLDARLNIAFEEQLPAIRRMLFGDMVLGTIKTQ